MSPRSPPVPPSPPTAEPNLLDGGGAPACLRALFADEGGGLEELGEIGHLLVVALGGESVSFFLLLHAEVLPLSSRASSFLARLDVVPRRPASFSSPAENENPMMFSSIAAASRLRSAYSLSSCIIAEVWVAP
eukprot:CAMPEP_0170194974 /NCGR_PEP_ID=MMETSP0040_2-20121228/60433_1 /TAXON_ID=641309 /ORGANISM="Lotharella oceanica, Strain CCMP622" /LENGTH=132 /DNA_ID=CAMNT_0010444015 /DNA_START=494 /DNA_END=890 /DNA_ORIENTATION=+